MASSAEFSKQSLIQVSGQNNDALQAGKFSELSAQLQGAWPFLLPESLWEPLEAAPSCSLFVTPLLVPSSQA